MSPEVEAVDVLFIHADGEWDAQDGAILQALSPFTRRVTHAQPVPAGSEGVQTTDEAVVVLYSVEQGIAGALAQTKWAHLIDSSVPLLVVSDQLLGPLEDLDALMRVPLEGSEIQILVEPDARHDLSEEPEFAAPEYAGLLAMEMPWLRLPPAVLRGDEFWEAVNRVAGACEADSGWLAFADLTRALGSAGLTVHPAVSFSGDLFARNLHFYQDAKLPFLPWALFTSDPLELERWAVVPRPTFDYLLSRGYPQELFWSRVLKSCPPQNWYTNLALLDLFPDSPPHSFTNALSTAVIAHVYYPQMLGQMLKYAGNVPDPAHLFVTTDTAEKKHELEAELRRQNRFDKWQVRVVKSNRGRDVSAFLVDCEDVLRDPQFDLVLKLHSKQSLQDPKSVSGWFREHLLENLLHSSGYVQWIYKRFQEEPLLGMVMPPVIHMGAPTMGNGWTLNKGSAGEMAGRLGVTIPFDTFTPLSPYGSMFFARREALLPLVDARYEVEEFPTPERYRDGSMPHVLERLFSYVVFSQGYYARCVQTLRLAEISAVALQYKYDQVSHYLFPFASRQVKMLVERGQPEFSGAEMRSFLQRKLSDKHPRLGAKALDVWMSTKRTARSMRDMWGEL